jgi:hypothetical protein
MNAFPDTILTPKTSNRLRLTPKNEGVVQQLLELEVDAASFFMPEDEIPDGNKPKVAFDDLIDQLSPEVRAKVFPSLTPVVAPDPVSPVKAAESEDDNEDGGMNAGMSMSLGKKEESRKRPLPEEEQEVEGSDMEM